MSPEPRVVAKIRKLLALARGRGTTAAEAATAAARAQALMERHRIDECEVAAGSVGDVGEVPDPLWSGSFVEDWLRQLANSLCALHDCRLLIRWATAEIFQSGLWRRTFYFIIVGRETDAVVVRYLFAYLKREIDRLADAAPVRARGMSWERSFRRGAVQSIVLKLRAEQERARCGATTTALVYLGDRGRAAQSVADRLSSGVRWSEPLQPTTADAMMIGRIVGDTVDVAPRHEGLPATPAKLEEGE